MREEDLFFIVGVGRSGTTLLMSMLNAHPEIGTPPETHFVTSHMLGRPRVSLSNCRAALERDPRIGRLGLDMSEILDAVAVEGTVAWRDVYFRILQDWKVVHGVRLVGEKAPKYVQFLPKLQTVAPRSRVIHLIRDPRAVFLSRRKAAWSAGRPDWSQLLAYAVQYAEGRVVGPRLFGDRYREVLYERLIADPESELASLSDFLGVDYDPVMLRFAESAADIISEDEWSWKREATGPLLTQNAEKWRNELLSSDVARVESACRGPFDDGFYQVSIANAGFTAGLYGLLIRGVARAYRWVLRLRRFAG